MNSLNENLRLVFLILEDKNVELAYYQKRTYKQKVVLRMLEI